MLTTNFPSSRTIWDLHHNFDINAIKGRIDLQFDVSFFKDWNYPPTLSSYKASEHENMAPDIAINILFKSTWALDLSEHVDLCELLKIPIYIVFSAFNVTPQI
ncbi:MAG: hypothetical protein ACTSVI_07075 [Promethearchaeota archaeon]